MKKILWSLLLATLAYSWEISVEGDALQKSVTMDEKELRALPQKVLGEVAMVCNSGAVRDKGSVYKGVRLIDVLDKAAYKDANPKAKKEIVVSVIGDDGYEALFTYQELYNTTNGAEVTLAYEKNGTAYDKGAWYLISPNDIKTGARHVWDVKRIVVTPLSFATHVRKPKKESK